MLFRLWLLCEVTKANLQQQAKVINGDNATTDMHFKHGTLFLELGKLHAANSRVIVPVSFGYSNLLESYSNYLFEVDEVIKVINRGNTTSLSTYINELESLKEDLRGGLNTLNEFFHSFRLTGKRKRRGAFNIIGTISNSLFGLVTEDQLNKVKGALGNLENISDKNLKDLNIVKSVISLNVNRMTKLRKAQEKTFLGLAKLSQQMKITVDQINKLSQATKIEQTLSDLKVNFLKLFMETDRLVGGVKNIFSGIVDEHLISTKFILHMLHEIKAQGHFPILPDDYLNARIYRKIIKVTAFYDSVVHRVQILFSVPTFSSQKLPVFDLFSIDHFPLPIKGVDSVIKFKNLPKFFAKAKKYHWNLESLEDCRHFQGLYFCDIKNGLFDLTSPNSCSAHLFQKMDDFLEFCPHSFSSKASNTFLKIQNELYYYINSTLDLEFNCPDPSYNKHVTLSGLGSLTFGPGCIATGAGLLFPASVASYADTVNLEYYHTPKTFSVNILNTTYLPFDNGKIIANITKENFRDLSLEELQFLYNLGNTNHVHRNFHRFDIVDAVIFLSVVAVGLVLARKWYSDYRKEILASHTYEVPKRVPNNQTIATNLLPQDIAANPLYETPRVVFFNVE